MGNSKWDSNGHFTMLGEIASYRRILLLIRELSLSMINQTLMKSIKCSSKENSISNSSKLSDLDSFLSRFLHWPQILLEAYRWVFLPFLVVLLFTVEECFGSCSLPLNRTHWGFEKRLDEWKRIFQYSISTVVLLFLCHDVDVNILQFKRAKLFWS